MSFNFVTLLLALSLFHVSTAMCKGDTTFDVTFRNQLTPRNFGNKIPSTGLVFSPIVAITHSNRLSFLTVRGKASAQIEQIAETGMNGRLVSHATFLRDTTGMVKTVAAAPGPTMPGSFTRLRVVANQSNPFLTVVSMIAPSPDWIVQLNNVNLCERFNNRFGVLIAYDTGTDSGRNFTSPVDASLDMPTEPQQNIAPLVEDETDRFAGRPVGRYQLKRVSQASM